MSQIIGKVGMTPRGMYERTRTYERLDVVTYQGSSWVAIVDVPAQISPALGSDYWQLQARMGETGPQGPVGPQGNSAFMNDGTVNKYELVNNLTQGGENAVLSAEQGKILKQELTELESETDLRVSIKPGKNLFDKDSVIVDCRFLSDGTIQKNDYTIYFAITGYIPCEPLTSYNLTKEGNSSVVSTGSYCCFYTKDLELISTKEGSFTNFTTPENCTYMRLTVLKDALNSKIQLQKGTTYRTEYEEYQPIEGYLDAVKNLESEVASSMSLLSERVAEVDVNLSTIEDTIGISHKLVKTIEAAGGYARVEVFVISLEEGKKYVFEATDLQSNTNTNYAYIYDSDGNELAVKGGVGEKIILEYTPTQKLENAVIKVASYNATTLKCILTEDTGDNKITKLEERVGNLFNGNDVVELSITDKFFVTAATGYEGTLSDSETSCATSFIPVRPKSKIRIDNLYLVSNRSVCAYDKERKFVAVMAKNSYDTSATLDIPEECYYVRASGKVGVPPVVTYLTIPYGIDEICITGVDGITITNGKYITRFAGFEGMIDDASDSAASDYIKVIPGSIITIDGAYSEGNRSCCAYDKDKKFVAVIVSNQTATRSTANIQLPLNAYYIRITSAKDVIPSVKYVNTIIDGKNVIPQYITNERLFDDAASVPVLSFVDDDTWGVQYVERLKNLCDTLDIKLSFACLTEQVEKNEGLLETLLSFEREGFPIIFHGNQQIEAYRGATAEDLIAQERDFVKGLQMMHKFGFSDYKIWVTPFGQARPDQRALAMKWGMEAIITSAGIRVTNDPTIKEDFVRYRLLRNGLGNNVPMTADELAENVANIKIAIDKAVACKGWCLVSMHSAFDMFFNGELDSTISEIVQYARDKGVEIRTVNEELRRRRPIFNYYEQY